MASEESPKRTCFVVMGFRKEDRLRDGANARPRQDIQVHHQAGRHRRRDGVHARRRDTALGRDRRADVRKTPDRRRGGRRPLDLEQERLLRAGRASRAAASHDHRHLRGRSQELSLRREPRAHPAVPPHGRGHRLRGGGALPSRPDEGDQRHHRPEPAAQRQSCLHVPQRPHPAGAGRGHAGRGHGGGEGAPVVDRGAGGRHRLQRDDAAGRRGAGRGRLRDREGAAVAAAQEDEGGRRQGCRGGPGEGPNRRAGEAGGPLPHPAARARHLQEQDTRRRRRRSKKRARCSRRSTPRPRTTPRRWASGARCTSGCGT